MRTSTLSKSKPNRFHCGLLYFDQFVAECRNSKFLPKVVTVLRMSDVIYVCNMKNTYQKIMFLISTRICKIHSVIQIQLRRFSLFRINMEQKKSVLEPIYNVIHNKSFRSTCSQVLYDIRDLKIFAKLTGIYRQ